jgi:hypothetical protein
LASSDKVAENGTGVVRLGDWNWDRQALMCVFRLLNCHFRSNVGVLGWLVADFREERSSQTEVHSAGSTNDNQETKIYKTKLKDYNFLILYLKRIYEKNIGIPYTFLRGNFRTLLNRLLTDNCSELVQLYKTERRMRVVNLNGDVPHICTDSDQISHL